MKKIAIFGAGIAGLTVAHECIEAGIEVDIYEKESRCGGKASCFLDESTGLYVEHAMRVYVCWYQSLFHTLKEIPYGTKGETVFDNLIPLKQGVLESIHKEIPDITYIQSLSISHWERLKNIHKIFKLLGFTFTDALCFARIILTPLIRCEAWQKENLWNHTFEDLFNLKNQSEEFRNFALSIFETITTGKGYASAALGSYFFCYRFLLGTMLNSHHCPSISMFMNGPTNERFIDPWVEYLKKRGVRFHMNSPIEKMVVEGGKGEKAILEKGATVQSDAYILALPYHTLNDVLPELNLEGKLHHEWGVTVMIYLKKIPSRMVDQLRVSLVLDSPWKLGYELEAPPCWTHVEFPKGILGIISVVVCNVNEPGILYNKPLSECSWEEVQNEVAAQLNLDMKSEVSSMALSPDVKCVSEEEYQRNRNFYDNHSEQFGPNASGYRWINESVHYIAAPYSYDYIPEPKTKFRSVFLAGEFVKCHLVAPVMEHASVAGKLCAKAVCDFLAVPLEKNRIPSSELPWSWIRSIDRFFHSFRKK